MSVIGATTQKPAMKACVATAIEQVRVSKAWLCREPKAGRKAASPDAREDARSGKDTRHTSDGARAQRRRGWAKCSPTQRKKFGVKQNRPVAHLRVEDQ
jgi:hypothetical protein